MTSATRRIECSVPRRGASAIIELLALDAPQTCQDLWNQLPIESDSYHSKWNGNEVFIVLPPFETLTTENLTDAVRPGDVVLFFHPPGDRASPAALGNAILCGYSELGFFYGPQARSYSPAGPVMGTRVGRIVQGLECLAEAAREMRRSGFDPMLIRHWKQGS